MTEQLLDMGEENFHVKDVPADAEPTFAASRAQIAELYFLAAKDSVDTYYGNDDVRNPAGHSYDVPYPVTGFYSEEWLRMNVYAFVSGFVRDAAIQQFKTDLERYIRGQYNEKVTVHAGYTDCCCDDFGCPVANSISWYLEVKIPWRYKNGRIQRLLHRLRLS
ncbi:MAG: hypothetical protein JWM52_322 [Candidatus Saccharibacteria bacterium]|nr:hypothetical protein [Candidatus Saccharibacteria bacterium]